MATLKELHKLCNTFDKAEKRFVSLYIKGLAGKAKENYLKQLDNICFYKTFNEDKLKEKMTNITTKRLSEFNTTFFDFLCKALIIYHSEGTENLKLLKKTILVDILLSKGMNKSVEKIINNAIEKYENKGFDEIVSKLYKQKYKLGLRNYISFDKHIDIQDKKIEALKRSIVESEYQKLNFKMNDYFVKGLFPRNKKQAKIYEDLLQNKLLKNNSLAISKYAKHYYYMIKIPLLVVAQKLEEASIVSLEAIQFSKENFDLKTDPTPLFLQYKRSLNLQFSMNKSENLLETVENIKKLTKSIPSLATKIDIWSTELDAHLNKALIENNYKEGINYFEKNAKEKMDKQFENVKRLDAKVLLLARLYFLDANYDLALHYAELANKGKQYKFKQASIATEFLILLCHHKMNNQLMLPYITKSLYRVLNNLEYLYAPEKALLSFLGKIKNPNNIQKEFLKLKKVFEKEVKNPFNNIFFDNGDYLKWLNDELSKGK